MDYAILVALVVADWFEREQRPLTLPRSSRNRGACRSYAALSLELDLITQEATMMIKVEGSSNNYRAFVDDEPDLSATGRTINGAIGRLVQVPPDKLRLTIDLEGYHPVENWPGFPRGHHRQQPPVEDVLDESHTMPGDERG